MCRKTQKMKHIEKKEGKPINDILKELYVQHGTQSGVAHALGINQSTLSLWLMRCGLEQRSVLVEIKREAC